MADTDPTYHGFGLEQAGESVANLPLAFSNLERAVVEDADAGAVVAAVFELAQASKDDGAGFLFTDISDDAAHSFGSWGLGARGLG
ncbi:MAG: hypothetical protein RI897_589 [Verrucomicrobiota bacterium]